jgi:diguanylate cyclase (GGDEF)-like protein/putative nucleotidyltransferase with HDIG domain
MYEVMARPDTPVRPRPIHVGMGERGRQRGGAGRRIGGASMRANALAVDALTPAVAARAQACLFLSAGAVGALGVMLPHPDRFNEAGMLGVQISSMLAAVFLFALPHRAPGWFLAIGPYSAAALTSVAVVFSGEATSAYLLFYLWVALYAFYYLSRRGAVALALFSVANVAAVMAYFRIAGGAAGPADDRDISAFVLMTGTIAVGGTFLLHLRRRVGGLIDQLTAAATTDHLTGLLNRRGFQRAIDTEMARSERSGCGFSLLLGDCDFFKHLNDSLGHQAGDRALVMIGQMLEAEKRRIDVAARIGGEEFALVLPETSQHEALMVAERIRVGFARTFSRQPIPLTLSVGVAAYPAHGTTTDDLMRSADEALYAAKALGRDRTVLHSAEIAGILSSREAQQRAGEETHMATVLNLAQALDMRDHGTARHSQTVGRYCELMARELGLSRDQVERVRLAGLLHDIGKIGVHDSILGKPGPLTDDEFEAMRKHPEIGWRILGGAGMDDIRRWVLAHHERPDGRGYPHGLRDAEIELEAKILAVGDAYEAMTSDRVYRASIGTAAARAELVACAGTQFDPDVVAAFLRVLDRGVAEAGPLALSA